MAQCAPQIQANPPQILPKYVPACLYCFVTGYYVLLPRADPTATRLQITMPSLTRLPEVGHLTAGGCWQ
eukprot:scaffold80384_cov23-Tisochrysis_lutea.AAC.1